MFLALPDGQTSGPEDQRAGQSIEIVARRHPRLLQRPLLRDEILVEFRHRHQFRQALHEIRYTESGIGLRELQKQEPLPVVRFLDDGRVEIDSNVVGRAIRPIALNRKNALFAGSDGGAEHWAVVASLVETCKLNAIDPQAYLSDVLTRIVNGHPNSRIDELLPWAYAAQHSLKDVA